MTGSLTSGHVHSMQVQMSHRNIHLSEKGQEGEKQNTKGWTDVWLEEENVRAECLVDLQVWSWLSHGGCPEEKDAAPASSKQLCFSAWSEPHQLRLWWKTVLYPFHSLAADRHGGSVLLASPRDHPVPSATSDPVHYALLQLSNWSFIRIPLLFTAQSWIPIRGLSPVL